MRDAIVIAIGFVGLMFVKSILLRGLVPGIWSDEVEMLRCWKRAHRSHRKQFTAVLAVYVVQIAFGVWGIAILAEKLV